MPFRPLQHARPRRAFTLVELLCSVVIVGIMAAGLGSIIQQAARSNSEAAIRAQLASEANVAMDRIIRRLAQITTKPATTPAEADIDSMTATAISFDNGSSLTLSGTNLIFRDIESGDTAGQSPVLLRGVSALALEARNESNALLAFPVTLANIRRVSVTITLTRQNVSFSLRGGTFLRACAEGAKL